MRTFCFATLAVADAGAVLFKLVATAMEQSQLLQNSADQVSANAKDAGTFTLGDQKDFVGGVQGMIG